MNKSLSIFLAMMFLAAGVWLATEKTQGEWSGVDESVVEHFAEKAGHPARDPYINTDKGDLLLFVFLLAGTCGGFVAGYSFRMLFPVKKEPSK